MKVYLILILLCLSWSMSWVLAANCTNSGGNTVCILEPSITNGQNPVPDFGDYLGQIFNKLIVAAAVLAVIMIAWFGFQYMFSNVPGLKSESKSRLGSVIGGLILVLAAWIILNEINPQITNNIKDSFQHIIQPLQTHP